MKSVYGRRNMPLKVCPQVTNGLECSPLLRACRYLEYQCFLRRAECSQDFGEGGSVAPYQLMPFEFGFQGFNFLLSIEFLLAKWFTGLQLIILHLNGEKFSTFPAPIGTLIE